MTGGHGHVTPRPDGGKARCGGPRRCRGCAQELADLLTIPGTLIFAGEPSRLGIQLAAETVHFTLPWLAHATRARVATAAEDSTIRLVTPLDQTTYHVTGWDTDTGSLVCERTAYARLDTEAARHIVSRLPRRGARLLADLRAELGADATEEEVLRATAARVIERKIPLFDRTPRYGAPSEDEPPLPPDCDAYTTLEGLTPRDRIVIPEDWCARPFEVDEEIRVGDEYGRRGTAKVLGWMADDTHPEILAGCLLSIIVIDKEPT